MTDTETPFNRDHFLKTLPESSGCYLMFNQSHQVIYVGKAKNLKRRVSSYFVRDHDHPKTRVLVSQIASVELMLTSTEAEAFLLEYTLIKKHNPRYNIIFRDDKSYPYVYVSTQQDFPGLYFYRGSRKKEGRLFGPFPNSPAVYATLNALQKIFPVRQCADSVYRNRARPCLQYQIKRCTAPCVGFVTKEDYANDVRDTLAFLEGKSRQVIRDKTSAMQSASETLNFERAAALRDQIEMLNSVQTKQFVAAEKAEDADVVSVVSDAHGRVLVQLLMIRGGDVWGTSSHTPKHAQDADVGLVLSAFLLQFYAGRDIPKRIVLGQIPNDLEGLTDWFAMQAGHKVQLLLTARGQTAQWLKQAVDNGQQALLSQEIAASQQMALLLKLKNTLSLMHFPKRMECYDISHLQGTQTVASQVVFIDGVANKTNYRRFNITGITPGDDPAAMRQVLHRRLLRGQQDGVFPDLLIVDGGKTQLKMAIEMVETLGLEGRFDVLSVAKGEGRKAGLETFYRDCTDVGIQLSSDDPVAHLLQRIRDEAHRFAITGQQQKRKSGLQSGLEMLPGIGPKTRQKLLRALGSMAAIKQADAETLISKAGLTNKQAQIIVQAFTHEH